MQYITSNDQVGDMFRLFCITIRSRVHVFDQIIRVLTDDSSPDPLSSSHLGARVLSRSAVRRGYLVKGLDDSKSLETRSAREGVAACNDDMRRLYYVGRMCGRKK